MTSYLNDRHVPGSVTRWKMRRAPFLILSLALHAGLLVALSHTAAQRVQLAERQKEQRLLDAGRRSTEQVRLERRMHDMALIKSLLEQSAAAVAGAPHFSARRDDDVFFSTRPRAPDALLKEAKALARSIDDIARATKAAELAELLHISTTKALAKLADMPRSPASPDPHPATPSEAAARIERLEAGARAVLEQRRQHLEQMRQGVAVTAGAASGRARAKSGGGAGRSDGHGLGANADVAQGGPGGYGAAAPEHSAGVDLSTVLSRIDAFANPDLPERPTQAYTNRDAHDVFTHGVDHVPDVAPGPIVRGTGRIIGSGGAYANRIYVNQWYLIGPFQGEHGQGLLANGRNPPESGVVLDAVYRGKGGRLLRWEYVDMNTYPLIPPDPAEDAVYYGYTELRVDTDQDLTLWVGADDDAQLWLNDVPVWKGGNPDRGWFFGEIYDTHNTDVRDYNLSEGKRVAHFRKGRNKLVFKLSNGPDAPVLFAGIDPVSNASSGRQRLAHRHLPSALQGQRAVDVEPDSLTDVKDRLAAASPPSGACNRRWCGTTPRSAAARNPVPRRRASSRAVHTAARRRRWPYPGPAPCGLAYALLPRSLA